MSDDTTPFYSELMTPEEVAALLKLDKRTLEAWRYLKKGPPYARIGPGKRSNVVYFRKDVFAWLQRFRVEPSR